MKTVKPNTREKKALTIIHNAKQFAGSCCEKMRQTPARSAPAERIVNILWNEMRAHLRYLGHLDDERRHRLPTTRSKVGQSYDSPRGIFTPSFTARSLSSFASSSLCRIFSCSCLRVCACVRE